MSADLIASIHIEPISWSQREVYAQFFGPKGAGLLVLPRPWCPKFLLVSAVYAARLEDRTLDAECTCKEILAKLSELGIVDDPLIIRSSVIGESIWDSGTYKSVRSTSTPMDLISGIRSVLQSTGGKPSGLVIQKFIESAESGEFGNLQRISKTRDHWENSTRRLETINKERFNSQRDIAPSHNDHLKARSAVARERFFGSIAAWLNNELLRGYNDRVSCEWVRRAEYFYLVQIDAEDEDIGGVNPLQLYIDSTIRTDGTSGEILKKADVHSCEEWDKLSVLSELFDPSDQSNPDLYFITFSSINSDTDKAQIESEFLSAFGKNIVVRTSVRKHAVKQMNLPKTDCLEPAEAAQWCFETAQELKKDANYEPLCFVAHRYIASRSSAWARVRVGNPIIEIHGNWGLPDALQFFPYDIWDIHLPTDQIAEFPNYKPTVLLLQDDGSWKYERVKNEVARFQSIGRHDLLEIAARSKEIADRLGEDCHIMWLVGCPAQNDIELNVPWYWTKAHSTENTDRTRYQTIKIRNLQDLNKLSERVNDQRKFALSLEPDSIELLRDNSFLKSVSDVANDKAMPIVLAGSTLAHAYFQLTKFGCNVISSADREFQRIRKQANFGKLVRDKIPAKIAAQKEQQNVARVPKGSMIGFLIGKFLEELIEVREAPSAKELKAELSDVYEVLRSLAAISGQSMGAVVIAADEKREKSGGFEDGQLLLQTSLPPANSTPVIDHQSTITPNVEVEPTEDGLRIPFNFMGFAEIGKSLVFDVDSVSELVTITLENDCIRVSFSPKSVQLRLFDNI